VFNIFLRGYILGEVSGQLTKPYKKGIRYVLLFFQWHSEQLALNLARAPT